MGQGSDNEVGPVEVGSILMRRMWPTECDEGLEVRNSTYNQLDQKNCHYKTKPIT